MTTDCLHDDNDLLLVRDNVIDRHASLRVLSRQPDTATVTPSTTLSKSDDCRAKLSPCTRGSRTEPRRNCLRRCCLCFNRIPPSLSTRSSAATAFFRTFVLWTSRHFDRPVHAAGPVPYHRDLTHTGGHCVSVMPRRRIPMAQR